ncbi:isocitrate lyase/phosphoenolpyruvate mutase family protein [Sphaerisporangium aureirubrum]|uniref:Isocitrate lyase/phosphoenolpyruvate mutase family protein n=1 Tax=Sphaerisporangium aureirubrum TaxID=1544736 RepID=A0ABW1NN11_9ACTN
MRGSKAAELRRMLEGPGLVRAAGAHNGLTARLVETAGFDAVWASSFEVSASYGLPDASLVTMTQYLAAAESMEAVVDLPVVADCDTGFGGPLNVAHMVRSYRRRGIAAVCFEDKTFPKANSLSDAEHELISVERFVEKIRAAVRAREDGDLVLIARTEALIAGFDIDEALHRGRAYARAGADAVLVHSKDAGPERVLKVAAMWDEPVPLVVVPTTYGHVSEDTLQEAGVRMVIYANQGLRALVGGVSRTLRDLRRHGRADAVDGEIVPVSEIFALQRSPDPEESS